MVDQSASENNGSLHSNGSINDHTDLNSTVANLVAEDAARIASIPAIDDLDPVADAAKIEAPAEKDSTAEVLINLAAECELWRDDNENGIVTFLCKDHFENDLIESRRFSKWLRYQYYAKFKSSCNGEALNQAIATLNAKALHEGDEKPFPLRVAEYGESIYIDMADDAWRAIRIDRRGWTIDPNPPVRFRRRKGMRSLPDPVKGGSLDDLRKYLNIGCDDDWLLLLAWLTSAMRPQGPFAVLIVEGEQGSAKSTTARFLRSLIDPHVSLLRTEPRDDRDLMISANNSWLLAYDNISRLPNWLSDGLCRIATGGGYATRELFTNDGEVFFDAKRPILLNGIVDVATRPDLLNRSIIMNLPVIPESNRRQEADILAGFEADRAKIFGALLDLISFAMSKVGTFELSKHSRMADFDNWGTAIGLAIGLKPSDFLEALDRSNSEAIIGALESSPVACAVQSFMADRIEWNGTSTNLLDELNAFIGDNSVRQRGWPRRSSDLSRDLKRLAPPLRRTGINIVFDRDMHARSVRLTRTLQVP